MMRNRIDTARVLAPEDIRIGDYVAVLNVTVEWPPFYFGDFCREVVRTVHLPCDAGKPLKVESVCLPFVLVSDHKGEAGTLDVRRIRLAKLSTRYAERAVKRLNKAAKVSVKAD